MMFKKLSLETPPINRLFESLLKVIFIDHINKISDNYNCSNSQKMYFNTCQKNSNPIPNVLKLLEIITPAQCSTLITQQLESLGKEVLTLLFIQHINDPNCYVSHDARHSINVTNIMTSMFHNDSKYQSSLQEKLSQNIVNNTHKKQLVSLKDLSLFTIHIGALLHDIGYPNQQHHNFQKSNHAIEGAKLFNASIKPILISIFNELNLSEQLSSNVTKQINDIILYHGADVNQLSENTAINRLLNTPFGFLFASHKNCNNIHKLGQITSCCIPETPIMNGINIHAGMLTKGRFGDALQPNDNQLIIPHISGDIISPDVATLSIRIADNIDTTFNRLTTEQQNITTQLYNQISQQLSNLQKNSCQNLIIETPQNTHQQIKAIYQTTNPYINNLNIAQIKFFVGLYAICDISLNYTEQKKAPIVTITVQKEAYQNLKQCLIKTNNSTISIANFYIERIKDSFKSITYNEQPLITNVIEKN